MTGVDEQLAILTDAAVDCEPPDGLRARLAAVVHGARGPLRVKFGVDPTSAELHLGHSVVLRRLRDFQDLGHTAVLIVGGFTARVGDPSGRSATRPALSAEEVAAHAATYVAQARRILSPERLEVVDNAAWLESMDMADVLALTASTTVARMLERNDFAARYAQGRPIALSEFCYPLLQGRDSVEVRADVELGGTDQLFNLLMGRHLQSQAGQDPQCVLTMPLLEGTDGAAKMSKSAGNVIAVTDPPAEMFGKVMSVRDDLMVKYWRLATDARPDEVRAVSDGLADGSLHPAAAKRRLAARLVSLYHGADAAQAASERFDRQFVQRGVPDDVPVVGLDRLDGADDRDGADGPDGDGTWFLPTLLRHAGLVGSGGEARRMVRQGAVRLDGEVLGDETSRLHVDELDGRVLQVGKRRFARLRR